MQGAGKMSPVAGLFSEVQDEVLADCVFEEMVRKDNPGLVKLNGQASLGSAVHVDGSRADGVALDAEAMGLAREAEGTSEASSELSQLRSSCHSARSHALIVKLCCLVL